MPIPLIAGLLGMLGATGAGTAGAGAGTGLLGAGVPAAAQLGAMGTEDSISEFIADKVRNIGSQIDPSMAVPDKQRQAAPTRYTYKDAPQALNPTSLMMPTSDRGDWRKLYSGPAANAYLASLLGGM